MEWSKIKNIVILILVFVNAALLFLVGARETRRAQYEADTWSGAVAALEKNGISFAAEEPPRDMELPALEFTRDREGEQAAAEMLLGPVEEQADSSPVRTVYAGTGGWAEFSMSGEFSIQAEPGVPADGEDCEKASQACLEKLGFQGTLTGAEERGAKTVLIFRQEWNGAPLFSCQVELTWEDGCLTSLRGQRLAGTSVPAGGNVPLDTATVLVRFLAGLNREGYVCSSIQRMTAGYVVSGTARPVQLIPVWLIETDSGSYYVDGTTGALSVVE